MRNTVNRRVFKFWFGWNPERIETWLSKKAEEGWILEETDWSMLVFHFRKGVPSTISFGIDFYPTPSPAYKKRAMEKGWALISENLGWFLWCKTYTEKEAPQFLSDKTARLSRIKKLLGFLMPIGAAQFAVLPIVSKYIWADSVLVKILTGMYALVAGILLYSLTRVFIKYMSIQKEEEIEGETHE